VVTAPGPDEIKDAEKIWSDGLKVSSNNIVLLRNLGALLFEKKGENFIAKKEFENKKSKNYIYNSLIGNRKPALNYRN